MHVNLPKVKFYLESQQKLQKWQWENTICVPHNSLQKHTTPEWNDKLNNNSKKLQGQYSPENFVCLLKLKHIHEIQQMVHSGIPGSVILPFN